MQNFSQLENEPLLAAYVLAHALHETPELAAKLCHAVAIAVTDEHLARRCEAVAQHARDLISEVEQLRLEIQSPAKSAPAAAQVPAQLPRGEGYP